LGPELGAPRLAAQSDELGAWKTLFNGRDLSGWQNAKPNEGHHKGPNRWKVEDGALTQQGDKSENDVATVEEFGDYELEIEYKIPPKGNSGVYLRGTCEIQVYDSFGKPDDKLNAVDAGAIYGVGYIPLKNAQKPAGEWNQYRVVHVGHHITVWHNGVLIHDHVWQDKATGGAMGTYPGTDRKLDGTRGPLMLQGDHSKVWYRNIRIRPLFEGWTALWNGKDLSEFTARGDKRAASGLRWEVKDHAFTNTRLGGDGHDIWTNQAFGNFLAYYEYLSDTKAQGSDGNSGLYLRDQWEIQIYGTQSLTDRHTDGCLYSLYTPLAKASREANHWNRMIVKLSGNKVWVWQNGVLIHDGRELTRRTDSDRATEAFSKAPFKIQGDHAKVWFTNLKIKPLPDGPGG
jgi:hypothetical protein